jgi:hypothetical protein
MSREFVLISDDDGHHYVCPADLETEAGRALDAIRRYWDDPPDDVEAPDLPDYLTEVGGSPTRVKFTGYRIE